MYAVPVLGATTSMFGGLAAGVTLALQNAQPATDWTSAAYDHIHQFTIVGMGTQMDDWRCCSDAGMHKTANPQEFVYVRQCFVCSAQAASSVMFRAAYTAAHTAPAEAVAAAPNLQQTIERHASKMLRQEELRVSADKHVRLLNCGAPEAAAMAKTEQFVADLGTASEYMRAAVSVAEQGLSAANGWTLQNDGDRKAVLAKTKETMHAVELCESREREDLLTLCVGAAARGVEDWNGKQGGLGVVNSTGHYRDCFLAEADACKRRRTVVDVDRPDYVRYTKVLDLPATLMKYHEVAAVGGQQGRKSSGKAGATASAPSKFASTKPEADLSGVAQNLFKKERCSVPACSGTCDSIAACKIFQNLQKDGADANRYRSLPQSARGGGGGGGGGGRGGGGGGSSKKGGGGRGKKGKGGGGGGGKW